MLTDRETAVKQHSPDVESIQHIPAGSQFHASPRATIASFPQAFSHAIASAFQAIAGTDLAASKSASYQGSIRPMQETGGSS
jgi:hypothetical protein